VNLALLRTLRWAIVGLGLAAGALLVATGHVLLGALLGGFALLRLALVLGMEGRRRQFRMARTTSVDGAPPVLRTLARGQFEVTAAAIGIPSQELRIEFAKGQSIAEVAGARGVPLERVVAAVVADASAKVDRAVADGEAAPGAADRIKTRLPHWATRMVNGHRGELRTRVASTR
jgi:hypothetical protein